MSYPYPQDRNRDRQEKGEQPYKDARQELTQADSRLQAEAEAFGEAEANQEDTGDARLREEGAELLRDIKRS